MYRLQETVLLTFCVYLVAVSAVPLGILPDVPNAAPSPGRQASVVHAADPATLYKWFLQLFTRPSFINWLGRARGINFQPGARPNSGGTSDLLTGGTSDSFSSGRLEEENSPAAEANLDVVRDYSPTAASTSTSHHTLSQEPTVQRDFQADNIIIPQTVKPQGGGQVQIPVLSLKETAGLVEESSRPSSATIPNDLVVIRDHETEEVVAHAPTSTVVSNSFVHSRLSETQPSGVDVQTVNTSPVPVVTSENLEDLNVQRDEESPNLVQEIPTAAEPDVTSGSDDVSNLSVARDREEGSPSVPLTTTPDLEVIRDRVSEDDNGHIVSTRGTDSPSLASTKSIGNGILILLPGGGNK